MRKFSILLTLAALTILAIGAQAEISEFWAANSQFDPANRLGIDHVHYNNIDSGWFRDDGVHFAGNQNYQTGFCYCDELSRYHGYLSFDLSGFAGNASVGSVKLNNFDVGDRMGTLFLYGTDLMPGDVDSQQDWNDVNKYRDLNRGVRIGALFVYPEDSNKRMFIGLDAAGVSWLNRHAGKGAVIGFEWRAVPEPGSLLLLGTGLIGGIGMLRRRLL